jgi:hypothetical protein
VSAKSGAPFGFSARIGFRTASPVPCRLLAAISLASPAPGSAASGMAVLAHRPRST